MTSSNDLPPPLPDATPEPEDMWRSRPPAAAPEPGPSAAAIGSGTGTGSSSDSGRPYEAVLAELVRSYLQDRRVERRWRLFYRLLWLVLLGWLGWTFMSPQHHVSAPNKPHTALVEVRGEIAADTEASAELIIAALKSAFEDHGSQAVVLRINSPGGSPVQAGIVHDEIKRLKARHGKKVYAVVEEMCASGAYYIAAAADEIYVDKASIVGSIGVLMEGFGFTGLMDKLGVERRLLTAGDNKAMLDPYQPVSPKHKAYAQAMLDQIHAQFITVVREGRGERLKETPEMFSGLFWNGEQAVQMGLADNLGNLDYVAREVVKAEEVVDYTPRDNVAERLAKRFGAAMGEGAVKAARQLSPVH